MFSRSLGIPSVAVVTVGCPSASSMWLSVALRHTERQPDCQGSCANNGFPVNGLCEIGGERYAFVWPVAGTLVPNSHTKRRPGFTPRGKALPTPSFVSDLHDCE